MFLLSAPGTNLHDTFSLSLMQQGPPGGALSCFRNLGGNCDTAQSLNPATRPRESKDSCCYGG